MARERLDNKPLVEALFEIRWHLQAVPMDDVVDGSGLPAIPLLTALSKDGSPELQIDPHFQLLPGRLYDRVEAEYPKHEPLPASLFPLAPEVVQHRFRHSDGWPIIQVGPGLLTVNDTDKYKWEDFQPRCTKAINDLYKAYPAKGGPRAKSLVLRYINAVDVDFSSQDIGAFLRDHMDVTCSLPAGIFEGAPVEAAPHVFRWQTSYRCSEPAGTVTLLFYNGTHKGKSALIWETIFQTGDGELPGMPGGIEEWLGAAHEVTDGCFFKLIKGGTGDLYRQFAPREEDASDAE